MSPRWTSRSGTPGAAPDLSLAIRNGELAVLSAAGDGAQTVAGSKVTGFEALARWMHRCAFVPPGDFIPLAEESGLIVAMGNGSCAKRAASRIAVPLQSQSTCRRRSSCTAMWSASAFDPARNRPRAGRLELEITEAC
jgi:EAL domain-containing protein (putative c-di-GMP-specific phosphodiesterase class I)